MRVLKAIVKNVRIEEWVALIVACGALAINVVVFRDYDIRDQVAVMVRYITFNQSHFYTLFFLFLYILYIGKAYLGTAKNASDIALFKRSVPKSAWREVVYDLMRPIHLILPLVIVAAPLFALLGSISYALRDMGKDLILLAADKALFGVIPFIDWPTHASWIVTDHILLWSYFSLGIVMSGTLAILFISSRTEYRKAVLAFILSLTIAFPIFSSIPCQDPSNYFIHNLRGNTFTPEMQTALDAYNPSAVVEEKAVEIARAETDTPNDNAVPVSCFPSMHATWSLLVVFYLARTRKWTLFASIPWALLLMGGGIYLAQHYVIDYIVAVPVAALAVWLAHILITWEARWPWKKNTPHPRAHHESWKESEPVQVAQNMWRKIIQRRNRKDAK